MNSAGKREICICYCSVSGVSGTGLPGQIGTIGTIRFAEFHGLFGGSDSISKLFLSMEAAKSMTCYFDLGMRNKVLSVLLAAGMVASMPAATAFNVMADDAVAVESTADDSNITGADANNTVDLLAKTNYTKIYFNWTTETNKIKVNENDDKTVDTDQVKVSVTGDDKSGKTVPLDNNVTVTAGNYSVNPTCTTDGKIKFTATVEVPVKDSNGDDSKTDFVKITSTSPEYTVAAFGHKYNYTDKGTWTWSKTGNKNADGTDEYSVTFSYTCDRCGNKETVNVPQENVSEIFKGDSNNNYPACTNAAEVDYNAFVKIGDDTYYPTATASKATYKINNDKVLVDKDGKVIEDGITSYDSLKTEDKAKAVVVGYQSTGAVKASSDSNTPDFSASYTRGHEWKQDGDFDWTVTADKDYLDKNKKDVYLNTVAKAAGSDTNTSEILTNVTSDAFTNHYSDVKVAVKCDSIYHTAQDAVTKNVNKTSDPRKAIVPAWVYVDHDPATCTTDATTTYYAYVFKDADDIKAKLADLVSKVNASGNDKIEIGTSDSGLLKEATDFYINNQVDNNGQGFGSFQATKTDTWEGSATGHNYYVSGWTWSNDFSYVTINLGCGDKENPANTKHMITVQSSQITKNADGTAKVVYTAKDARKYAIVNWYGKDGYYLDQTKNPYGKEYTINALPLKNAGDVNNGKIVMTRLFNKTTGEHLYTSDANEVKTLVNEYNWTNEGVAWNAPAVSNTPVYRLFNRVTGEHFYSKDLNEVNNISKLDDWKYEGIAWYSDDNKTVPVYRQFDPKAATSKASHNYTTSTHEKKVLTTQHGWNDEGIAWYGV